MSQEPPETDICVRIFTVSASMVGVCLTVIGLFRIVTELKNVDSIGDNLLAVDALAFLTSFILSHIALRARGSKRNQWLEKIADAIFLMALSMMVVICGLIAYAFV
jgi:hypothetical protein